MIWRAFPDWQSVVVASVAASVFVVALWIRWEEKAKDEQWDDEERCPFLSNSQDTGMPTVQCLKRAGHSDPHEFRIPTITTKRDATAAELATEPLAIIEELAKGRLGATETTVLRARVELQMRRMDHRTAQQLDKSLGHGAGHLYLVERGR